MMVWLPKYGIFGENDTDKEQIEHMESEGFVIDHETMGGRVWIKHFSKEVQNVGK